MTHLQLLFPVRNFCSNHQPTQLFNPQSRVWHTYMPDMKCAFDRLAWSVSVSSSLFFLILLQYPCKSSHLQRMLKKNIHLSHPLRSGVHLRIALTKVHSKDCQRRQFNKNQVSTFMCVNLVCPHVLVLCFLWFHVIEMFWHHTPIQCLFPPQWCVQGPK